MSTPLAACKIQNKVFMSSLQMLRLNFLGEYKLLGQG
jgi:hypothetical protein